LVRNENDVGVRLQRAGLELFRERGYDRTTAAEIAERAGVTERTFFRYFPDKREVLFDGAAKLRAALLASIADAPDGLGPLDTLFRAFRSVRSALEANRPFFRSHDMKSFPILPRFKKGSWRRSQRWQMRLPPH
jgi:AcrR family transcriptional regulator